MAKSSVFDSSATVMARVTELKKELKRLVNSIVEDDDYHADSIDRAKEFLSLLMELKVNNKRSQSFKVLEQVSCPEEFSCPISKELMRDPVIVSTGQTYDRPFINNWLKAGNRTCPRTKQVLSHTLLTPNHVLRELISKWCRNQGMELADPADYVDEDRVTEAERDRFFSLLKKMSSTTSEQKEAAKELRSLTKKMPSFRSLFGESFDAIPQLLSPLIETESHPDLQEDVITTLLNLSIHDNNKKLVAETPMVISLLLDALKSGTIETRSNSAAALFTLSALDSNKVLIGKSGALKPLIELLEEGHSLAIRDVASAIFSLCIIHENKARAVHDGAVRVIIKKIMDSVCVDELLALLAMLSSHRRAIEEIVELRGIQCLLSVIRENSCGRNKENCIAILYTICFSDRTKWKEIREEENARGTISKLSKDGTSRAKRKAMGILERLNRCGVNLTHTA